ncbi:MAG: hypothetical protein ABIW82_05520 [Dokdonella sp.]
MIVLMVLLFVAWSERTRTGRDEGPASVAADRSAQRRGAIWHDQTKDVFATRANGVKPDAARWIGWAEAVIARKHKRRWGDRIGTAFARPPDKAWAALLAIAQSGDPDAALASQVASQLAAECRDLRDENLAEENFPRSSGPPLDSPLPASWWNFTEDVTRLYRAWSRSRAESCRRVDISSDVANALTDRFVDKPDVEATIAQVNYETEREIAARRQIVERDQNAPSRVALGRALLRSGERNHIVEGLAILEGIDDSTGEIDGLLEPYHRFPNGGLGGDPILADLELERAAGLGDWGALGSIREQHEIAGRPELAWAWALYPLGLAQIGCFAFDQPDASSLDGFAEDAFRIERTLTPLQIDEGLAAAAGISAKWSREAERALDCD